MEKVKTKKNNKFTTIRELLYKYDLNAMIELSTALDRKFVVHCGPTNSGKTYESIQALKKANKGVYLGPLRLLALEMYDSLNHDGIPCSLITGEEKIIVPFSNITASTIEVCDFDVRYDVAVIDEAQMIADKDRGGNWLKAILLLNAKEIHICTAPEALNTILDIIKKTHSKVEVFKHERLTPLKFSGKIKSLKDVRPGDALIVFSRRGVLSVAAELEELKIKASVIYGALPPAARREEVRKFNDGETSVVVATDAIGMGVSLPIRRVIFCKTKKFNGTTDCLLTTSEIKQIAGRAGRYGKYNEGEVLTFENPHLIENAIINRAPYVNKVILPFPEILLESDFALSDLLYVWDSIKGTKNFLRADMREARFLLRGIQGLAKTADKEMVYSLICCPVDIKRYELVYYWTQCARAILAGNPVPYPDFSEDSLKNCELKYKAYDIYQQMCNKAGYDISCEKEKTLLCNKINSFLLESKNSYISKCSRCGRKLPIGETFNVCDSCYNRFYK